MADTFTRMKFIWLDQVLADRNVSPQGFALAYVLIGHFRNRKTGIAYPRLETIAEHLGCTVRHIPQRVKELVTGGHLEYRRGGYAAGTYRANQYKFVFLKRTEPSFSERDETVLSRDADKGRNRPFCAEDQKGLFEQTERTKPANQKGRNRPTNPLNEPSEEPAEESISQNPVSSSKRNPKRVDDRAFENFWKQYPRKVAKGAARKAFRKALEKASAQDLELGAMRYAAEREGRDPEYTKHAATWLSKECWLDEPAPEHKNPLTAAFDDLGDRIRRRSLTDIAIDGGDL